MFLKKILFSPLSFLYGCITAVRNFLYNKGIKKSYSIPGKSIVIGNLSMGGTGKSPHTLYLWDLLQQNHSIAILSRGYGRKTKGLLEVRENHFSNEVGDEPLMFKKRVGEKSLVVVSESRRNGVDFIRSQSENAVILLDDAFQHRKVKAGFYILLTDYSNPYYSDCVIPSGTLREWKCGKNRADCIIVTKCPESLSDSEKQTISRRLNYSPFGGGQGGGSFPQTIDSLVTPPSDIEKQTIVKKTSVGSSPLVPLQRGKRTSLPLWRGTKGEDLKHIFFSRIIYGDLIPFGKEIPEYTNILLVTGIANPKPLESHLKRFCKVESIVFPDHHHFTDADLLKIHTKFDTFTSENSIIVTTEKDFVRLELLLTTVEKQKYPWHYQSIAVKIDEEEMFNALINNYVDTI